MIFKEYDVVSLTKTINSKLKKDMEGTILIVYDASPPEYEIEFMDDHGETISVLTLGGEHLKLVWRVENSSG